MSYFAFCASLIAQGHVFFFESYYKYTGYVSREFDKALGLGTHPCKQRDTPAARCLQMYLSPLKVCDSYVCCQGENSTNNYC